MFEMFDTVKVLNSDKKLVKEGIITEITSCGASVFQPKQEYPFTDIKERAEWFPFESRVLRMYKIGSKKK